MGVKPGYLLKGRSVVIWALLIVAIVTCPVKKAVRMYQQLPAVSQSFAGLYNHCTYQQEQQLTVQSKASAQSPLLSVETSFERRWGSVGVELPNRLFDSDLNTRGDPPLYLQYRKILV